MPKESQIYEIEGGGGSGTINRARPENVPLTYNADNYEWEAIALQNGLTESSLDTQPSTAKEPTDMEDLTDSQIIAEKDYIDIEYNTLVGEGAVLPTKKTIRLKHSKTVMLEGLGKNLSGQYFISSIKRSIDNSGGYSQSCTFIKTGFRDSLKTSGGTSEYTGSYTSETNRPMELQIEDESKIVKGSNVVFISDDAIYSGEHEGVHVPLWVRKKANLTVSQISPDGIKALLQPIDSWTYTSYLKKV